MLPKEPLLRRRGNLFGTVVMLRDPAMVHIQRSHRWKASFILSFTRVGRPGLCRKTAPKHDGSTPVLHSTYGVLWTSAFAPTDYILTTNWFPTDIQSSQPVQIYNLVWCPLTALWCLFHQYNRTQVTDTGQ